MKLNWGEMVAAKPNFLPSLLARDASHFPPLVNPEQVPHDKYHAV